MSRSAHSQLAIKRDYDEWLQILHSVFRTATDDLTSRIHEADQALRSWIELSTNWSLQPDPLLNETTLRKDAQQFMDILAILDADGPTATVLIPDTNAIAGEPDPLRYRAVAGTDAFVFLLLPTVLAELDTLKNSHRNPEFRTKVRRAITRIKGWRNQGSLRSGVTVAHTITVRAVANEPNMQHALSWLDQDTQDDRVIASVLEVQAAYPSARVVLVTEDINLLNKADVARIETAELSIS